MVNHVGQWISTGQCLIYIHGTLTKSSLACCLPRLLHNDFCVCHTSTYNKQYLSMKNLSTGQSSPTCKFIRPRLVELYLKISSEY